jgi:2'-5' RNA ligase/GNAT superfamily N-acetyltransferase
VAERHRLLVALVLDGPVATEIDGIRRALGSSQLGRIAPHVTLVPPTNVATEAIAEAERVVRTAAGSVASFEVQLGPPATFPHNRSVLYLAVSMAAELATLRSALLTGPFKGRDLAGRDFVPHVTLDSSPARHVDERMLADLSGFVTPLRIATLTLLEEGDGAPGRDAPGRRWAPITSYALDRGGVSGAGGLEIRLARGTALSWSQRALAASWDAQIPAQPTELFVVASVADEVVGIATWSVASDMALLQGHVVAPSSRGLGIGTRLLSFIEQVERDHGRSTLVVTRELGSQAEAYYEGRGFRREAPQERRDTESLPLVRRLRADAD